SLWVFRTAFGKPGYWNDAWFDAIAMLNFGTAVSVKPPFANPLTVHAPVAFTLALLPEYADGMSPRKFLKSELGVLNFRSYCWPFSSMAMLPSNSSGSLLISALFSLKV